MKSKIGIFLKTVIFIFIMSSWVYASNFADTYGFSAGGMSMGNAVTAIVNDWSSVYYNISGLGKTMHLKEPSDKGMDIKLKDAKNNAPDKSYVNQIAIGLMYTFPKLNINILRRDTTTGSYLPTKGDEIDSYGFLLLGMAVDLNIIYKLPDFISSARFGLGLGANADGSLTKVNDLDPRTHNFIRYGRETQRALIVSGIGLGFFKDTFGIGFGVNASFNGKGSVVMENVTISSDIQYPKGQAKMDLNIDPAIVAGIYFSPGKIINTLDGLEIGASFRQESKFEIYPFKAFASVSGGAITMNLMQGILDYYQPHTFVAGISYTLWNITASFDAEYQKWSDYELSTAKKISIIYTDGIYDFPNLSDIIIWKGGLKYPINNWLTVMGGYYFQPSVLSKNAVAGRYNYLDNDKHVGSLGLKFSPPKIGNMGGPVEIIVAYQIQYLVKEKVIKYAPTNENPPYSYNGTNHTAVLELSMKL